VRFFISGHSLPQTIATATLPVPHVLAGSGFPGIAVFGSGGVVQSFGTANGRASLRLDSWARLSKIHPALGSMRAGGRLGKAVETDDCPERASTLRFNSPAKSGGTGEDGDTFRLTARKATGPARISGQGPGIIDSPTRACRRASGWAGAAGRHRAGSRRHEHGWGRCTARAATRLAPPAAAGGRDDPQHQHPQDETSQSH
jgi:hypothetical protein